MDDHTVTIDWTEIDGLYIKLLRMSFEARDKARRCDAVTAPHPSFVAEDYRKIAKHLSAAAAVAEVLQGDLDRGRASHG